jgi:hypothetical protein
LWRASSFWELGGFSAVPVAEDWELQKRAMRREFCAVHVDALIFEHRIHEQNKWAADTVQYGGMAGVARFLEHYAEQND